MVDSIMNKIIKVPVECYSRVVGYFRPVNQWNSGQRAQFADRKTINIEKAINGKKEI